MTPDEILVLLLIKHKHSHFRPKATGLHDLSSSLGKSLQTWTMSYMCASECVTTYRRDKLASVGRLLSPVCLHCASADHSVSLQSLSRQCSGSHAAVGRSVVNFPGDRWWGSKWSSPPSPSPWQHLDSPAGNRCWPARGTSQWSPKRGHRHLIPRMWDIQPFPGETVSVLASQWIISLKGYERDIT